MRIRAARSAPFIRITAARSHHRLASGSLPHIGITAAHRNYRRRSALPPRIRVNASRHSSSARVAHRRRASERSVVSRAFD